MVFILSLIYYKTRVLISICAYTVLLILYILFANIFIKTLEPILAINTEFAISIFNKAIEPEVKQIETSAFTEPTKKPKKEIARQEDGKKKRLEQEKAKQKKFEEALKKEEEERQREIDSKTIVSEAIYNDSSLNNSAPKYPVVSRKEEEEGEVILLVKVDANGKASEIKIYKSSGFVRLDNASIYAVKNWVFKPAKNKLNMPVESTIKIPFVFKIQNSSAI